MLYRVDIEISGVERLTVGLLKTEFLLFAFVARWEFRKQSERSKHLTTMAVLRPSNIAS